MSKSTSHTNTPEGRLAEALVAATSEGVNNNKVIELLGEERPKVRTLLTGLTAQADNQPDSSDDVNTGQPKAPAVIIARSADVKKLIESLRLEEGFKEEMEKQRTFQLLKTGQEVPDFGRILKTFTTEMLVAIQNVQSPKLRLITPDRSFNDLVSAMDGHKTMPGQNDTYVDSIFSRHANQKPENWGAHIIESPEDVEVQGFDNFDLTRRERLKIFANHKKVTGVNGMDRWKFAHAMMQALKEGRPIDVKFWTMLDEDPAMSDSQLPCAYWLPDYRQVDFDWAHPGDPFGRGRFRRSVGGDVPNS